MRFSDNSASCSRNISIVMVHCVNRCSAIEPNIHVILLFSNFSVDHTRVRLRMSGAGTGTATKEKDEYLNANFVDGFRRSRAYIATQGPMQSTQNLFWRMLFEQDVKIIVMITHLFEGGKVIKLN